MELHVAGALELLEDDLVHPAAGVDQGGGDDGQAAALLDVAGGAEEALGLLQGVGVHAAGEDLAAVGDLGVVRPGQPGDAVQQDHHVVAELHLTAGLLQHHLGHLDVAGGRLVEGRADHLGGRHGPTHVGDLLRPLVDQQYDQVHVGVVPGNGVADLLQQDGLAGSGGGHYQAPLAHADRRNQVHDPHIQLLRLPLQDDAFGGVVRGQVLEDRQVADGLGVLVVDRFHLQQGRRNAPCPSGGVSAP